MNEAGNLIEAAEAEVDPELKAATLDRAIAMLAALDPSVDGNAYALGYAWYLYPLEHESRVGNASKYLSLATQFEPDPVYARLYLAHLELDLHHYDRAHSLLTLLDDDAFTQRGQPWRDVKVAELLICCELKLGVTNCDRYQLLVSRMLEAARGLDDGFVPNPTELATVLAQVVVGRKSGED